MSKIINITKENFEAEVLNSDKKILIDFFAVWCGPCKMVAPIVEEIADENPQIVVGKVNVDDEPELASRFGVMSIPTLVVVKDRTIIAEKIGYAPKSELEAMIK